MAGNERDIVAYLLLNKGKISLKHLGVVELIGAPNLSRSGFIEINNAEDVVKYLATEDSRKKADIYINNHGVSLKQAGSSFIYNRLQRANILEIFNLLGFDNPGHTLQRLDQEVNNFHKGNLERRNRRWQDFFSEVEFRALAQFLMVQGSPNIGFSSHPAEFILEAPLHIISEDSISVFTFGEYFEEYKDNLKIAIRRQWVGQSSDSEHKRALGLAKKAENMLWVFDDVVGIPRDGWRDGFPLNGRKTVYFLMIEKER